MDLPTGQIEIYQESIIRKYFLLRAFDRDFALPMSASMGLDLLTWPDRAPSVAVALRAYRLSL
jgi:hypothetical protein